MSKVVIVTGGSRGIGRATALLAAERDYAVAVNYTANVRAAEEVVGAIAKRGGKAVAIKADIGVPNDVKRLFLECDQKLGTLTALVNNAGIAGDIKRVDELPLDRLQQMFNVNVIGAFLCAQEAVRRMSTRHGGKGGGIVNVSSVASRLGGANVYVDYAASKGAIDTMTLGLAQEVAAEGIRVNCVHPGMTATEIHDPLGGKARLAKGAEGTPMKRVGAPEEIARGILWLLSEESSFMTGAFMDIAGGR
jgi:NAD(P)-dependent dehydrogenase (short-subunit alcohol dehydrogenase family)